MAGADARRRARPAKHVPSAEAIPYPSLLTVEARLIGVERRLRVDRLRVREDRARVRTTALAPGDHLYVRRAVLGLGHAPAVDPLHVDRVEVAVGSRPAVDRDVRAVLGDELELTERAVERYARLVQVIDGAGQRGAHLRVRGVERVRRIDGVARVERVRPGRRRGGS